MQNQLMLIIYGPTGVGKTDCALSLADRIEGEIVNADVGQFYTPLSIGTAKPDWKNSPIKHHLFDALDKPGDFSVTQYRTCLLEIMNDIWHRNKIPMIVGGSGFYISSIFFPPKQVLPKQVSAKQVLPKPVWPNGNKSLWDYLYSIDPQRALEIHPHDTYRITRALELWTLTGKKPSDYKPSYDPPASYYLLCLDRQRDDLYQRINTRVSHMIEQGWIEEVKRLKGTPWEQFLLTKKLIGYDDILNYLDQDPSERSIKTLIDVIATKTRNYAKRQSIFWKMLEKKLHLYHKNKHNAIIEKINLTTDDLTVYLNHLVKTILNSKTIKTLQGNE